MQLAACFVFVHGALSLTMASLCVTEGAHQQKVKALIT